MYVLCVDWSNALPSMVLKVREANGRKGEGLVTDGRGYVEVYGK